MAQVALSGSCRRARVLWLNTPSTLSETRAVYSLTRRSQRLSFLIAFTQYLFDSRHDRHPKILLVAAIIRHLAHIFFQGLQINHSVVAFGIIITAEPRGDGPERTQFILGVVSACISATIDRRENPLHLSRNQTLYICNCRAEKTADFVTKKEMDYGARTGKSTVEFTAKVNAADGECFQQMMAEDRQGN